MRWYVGLSYDFDALGLHRDTESGIGGRKNTSDEMALTTSEGDKSTSTLTTALTSWNQFVSWGKMDHLVGVSPHSSMPWNAGKISDRAGNSRYKLVGTTIVNAEGAATLGSFKGFIRMDADSREIELQWRPPGLQSLQSISAENDNCYLAKKVDTGMVLGPLFWLYNVYQMCA